MGCRGFLGWSFIVSGQAQVAAAEVHLRRAAGNRGLPGERLDQGPVRQAEGGPGRLRRQADGQRVAAGVGGDRLGQLSAQFRPAAGVDEPSARRVGKYARGRGWHPPERGGEGVWGEWLLPNIGGIPGSRPPGASTDAHGGQGAGAQEAVASQEVGGGRDLRPGGELASGLGGRAAPGQRRRGDIEHDSSHDGQVRVPRVAEQDAIADVQGQRIAEREPGDRRAAIGTVAISTVAIGQAGISQAGISQAGISQAGISQAGISQAGIGRGVVRSVPVRNATGDGGAIRGTDVT